MAFLEGVIGESLGAIITVKTVDEVAKITKRSGKQIARPKKVTHKKRKR